MRLTGVKTQRSRAWPGGAGGGRRWQRAGSLLKSFSGGAAALQPAGELMWNRALADSESVRSRVGDKYKSREAPCMQIPGRAVLGLLSRKG